MYCRKRIIVVAGLLVPCLYAGAQIRVGEGQVSASLESNSVYYVEDKVLGESPEDKFGTNDYLKVDYTLGPAGKREEIFPCREVCPVD